MPVGDELHVGWRSNQELSPYTPFTHVVPADFFPRFAMVMLVEAFDQHSAERNRAVATFVIPHGGVVRAPRGRFPGPSMLSTFNVPGTSTVIAIHLDRGLVVIRVIRRMSRGSGAREYVSCSLFFGRASVARALITGVPALVGVMISAG